MKQKLSISIDESVLKQIDNLLVDGRFRNKSHVVEFAVKRMVEKGNV